MRSSRVVHPFRSTLARPVGVLRIASAVVLAALMLTAVSSLPASGQPVAAPKVEGQPPAPKPAAPPGPPRLNPNVIEESITRGVEFLRGVQKPTGIWGEGNGKEVGPGGGWAVAYTALAGLALVESGAPTSDRAVVQAAYIVRAGAPFLIDTYEVALAILFLDRLKEPKKDDPLIRLLAARLIAGQSGTGGWGYKVPKLAYEDTKVVLDALRKLTPEAPPAAVSFSERPSRLGLCIKAADDLPVKAPGRAALEQEDVYRKLPVHLKQSAVFKDLSTLTQADPKDKRHEPYNPTTDNSNTHFAIIGLWAARRHDVPTERSFTLVARHFRTSFGGNGWAYDYVKGGSGSTPPMTCIGLLGLAIGNALGVDPGAPRVDRDPAIIKSLTMLSTRVGVPTGQTRNLPTPKEAGGLYFLWALERIGVLYDLRTLDDKDWYQWGAEILIGHQKEDGSWLDPTDHFKHPVPETALAILFLKRANLTQDLSKRLILDTSVLTTRVGDTPPKKEPSPAPTPSIDLSGLFTVPPKEEPPAPKAVPVTTPTTVTAPQPTAESEPPPAKKDSGTSVWVWVGVGVGVLALAGAAVVLVMKKKPAEKPKKKKGKKGAAKAAKAARPKPKDEDEEEDDD